MASVSMTVNGQAVTREVEPRTLLVEFLRQHLDLTGTHVGCDTSQCGACVVHVNGQSVKSCTMLAVQAEGAKVTTIEGLAKNGELHPMQAAFREHHGAAVRLLHARHDHERDRPRAAQPGSLGAGDPRVAGGQPLPLHRLPQHRQGDQRGRRGHEELRPWPPTGSALRSGARKTTASSPGAAPTPTTSTGRARPTPTSCARRTLTPGSTASTRAEALAAPGVLAVLDGDDVKAAGWGGLICGWMVKSRDGSDMKVGPHPILAQGKARYVGDHVACVVAETYHQARDAAELVEVDYEELPACVSTAHARDQGQALVHDDIARNTVYEWELGDQAAVDQAFASAAHVTRIDLVNNRLVPNAIEPRAAIGEYDRGNDGFTLYTTSQNPHVARLIISAFIGVAPEHKLHVIAPDVGGGFGSKIYVYAEECVCLLAAKKTRAGR